MQERHGRAQLRLSVPARWHLSRRCPALHVRLRYKWGLDRQVRAMKSRGAKPRAQRRSNGHGVVPRVSPQPPPKSGATAGGGQKPVGRTHAFAVGLWILSALLACSSHGGEGPHLTPARETPEECRAYAATLTRCFGRETGASALESFRSAMDTKSVPEIDALRLRCATQDERTRPLCR